MIAGGANSGHQAPPSGAQLLGFAVAAFCAALALRLAGLNSRDVWLDEIYTQFAVSRDWLGLIDDRVSRGHSPFYFALLKLSGIDPANVAGLRAVSAVFDAGAAALLTAGAARYLGVRAALLIGVLYVLSPVHIHWAQNARPYGLLMFFTAMGLVGTMGLLDTLGRNLPDEDRPDENQSVRGPRLLFAIGWSGACVTLTGGILAYLVVLSLPWWPGLRKGALSDPTFRQRWIKSQRVPSILAFLTYMLVSRVHVIDRIGDYWLETQRPFGLASLGLLVEEIGAGLPGQAALAWTFLPESARLGLLVVYVLGVLAAAIWAARRTDLRPLSWAATALGLGLLGVMLLMSLNTSLLTGRYMSPVWQGLLFAAGAALATAGRSGTGVGPIIGRGAQIGAIALVGVIAPFAVMTATTPGERRAVAPQEIATLVDALPQRHAPIVMDRSIFRDVRMELMLLRLDEPELPRPAMHGEKGGAEAAEQAEAGTPFFIIASPADWRAVYAPAYSNLACVTDRAGWRIALISSEACVAPFAPSAN